MSSEREPRTEAARGFFGDVEPLQRAYAEGYEAALALVRLRVEDQAGLDIEVGHQILPLARFADPMSLNPNETVVWHRDNGGLVDRAEVLSAIASLRKPEQSSAPEGEL